MSNLASICGSSPAASRQAGISRGTLRVHMERGDAPRDGRTPGDRTCEEAGAEGKKMIKSGAGRVVVEVSWCVNFSTSSIVRGALPIHRICNPVSWSREQEEIVHR